MIRITVFEDNTALRESLSKLLQDSPDFYLTGAYSDATDIINKLENNLPKLVLMDIGMPKVSGLQALQVVKMKYPDICVVMYTIFEDDDKLFSAVCLGADGYILKSATEEELLQALLQVNNGGAVMTPSIAKKVLSLFMKITPQKTSEDYNLTAREKEVLALLVKGYSYKMIAHELALGIETIRTYIKRIYEKLHVHSMSAAVVKALKEGLI